MQNIVYHIVYTTQKIASLKTGFIDGLNYIITGKSTSVQKKKSGQLFKRSCTNILFRYRFRYRWWPMDNFVSTLGLSVAFLSEFDKFEFWIFLGGSPSLDLCMRFSDVRQKCKFKRDVILRNISDMKVWWYVTYWRRFINLLPADTISPIVHSILPRKSYVKIFMSNSEQTMSYIL